MDDKPATSEEESGPSGGERLRSARRENNISVRDVAKELHIDEQKVRALEKNEFDTLGAPVFAKGHLRKYAELVGVSVDDIMTDYYQMNRSVGAPPVVGPKRKSPRDPSSGTWLIALIILAVLGAIAYWWYTRDPVPVPATTDNSPATLAPFDSSEAQDTAGEILPAEALDTAMPEPSEAESADTTSVADAIAEPPVEEPTVSYDLTASEPVNAPVSDLPQVEIVLTYSGDCWTEVSDASGRRLFYDLGQSGRAITLSGDAPLRVILGDSGNVDIKVAGNDYVIPASARTGRLARLSLDKP